MATFRISKYILKRLFKKPATLMYPVVPREFQERTRGQVTIDVDNCIACGICDKKCPANAIKVDRKTRTWTIERMQCIQCAHCVMVCPKKCLGMDGQYTTPDTTKTVHTFNIPEQKKPAAAGAATSGNGELKCDLETCVYCTLCAKQCPVGAITVDRAEKVWKVDKDACTQCGVCVEKCPKKCLSL